MWAFKRKAIVFFIFFLLILIALAFFYTTILHKSPTCFDEKQNGNEEGVDCGGKCKEVCKLKANRINVLWSKTFEVSDGISNITALVENPNFYYNISATYNIRTFDKNGNRINDFYQKINLKPGEKRLIFIPSVNTGGVEITKTFINFTEIESLTLGEQEEKEIIVTSKVLSEEYGQTRLSVGIKNTSLFPQRNIEIIAVLTTPEGEAVDVAKTFLEYLNKREEKKVFMTWQKNIPPENLRVDVYLRKIEF